jgi:hypothetical protein
MATRSRLKTKVISESQELFKNWPLSRKKLTRCLAVFAA